MFRFVSFMKFEMYEVQSESEAYLYNMIFLAQGSNERALESMECEAVGRRCARVIFTDLCRSGRRTRRRCTFLLLRVLKKIKLSQNKKILYKLKAKTASLLDG